MSGETFCPYKLVGAHGHEDSKFLIKLCKTKLREGAHVDKGGSHEQNTEFTMAMNIFKDGDLKRIYDHTPGTCSQKWAAVRSFKSGERNTQQPNRANTSFNTEWCFGTHQNSFRARAFNIYNFYKRQREAFDDPFLGNWTDFDDDIEFEDYSESDDIQEVHVADGVYYSYYTRGTFDNQSSENTNEGHNPTGAGSSNSQRTSQDPKPSNEKGKRKYGIESESDSEIDCVNDYDEFEKNLRKFLSKKPKATKKVRTPKKPNEGKEKQIGMKMKKASGKVNSTKVEVSGVPYKPETAKNAEASVKSTMPKKPKPSMEFIIPTKPKAEREKMKRRRAQKSSSLSDDEEICKVKVMEFKRQVAYAKVEVVYQSSSSGSDKFEGAAIAKRIVAESKLKKAKDKLRTTEEMKRKRNKASVLKKVFLFKKEEEI